MLSLTDLKIGTKILFRNDPHEVTSSELSKLGRGGSFMRTKLKNLRTGAIIDYTFKGNESIEPAELDSTSVQFLYKDDSGFHFMDQSTYEQFSLTKENIGDFSKFLKENETYELISFNNSPITISMPFKITLEVVYTEPGLKGDTVSSPQKPARLETGAQIFVPLFIKTGDKIIVDTRNGSYVERAK